MLPGLARLYQPMPKVASKKAVPLGGATQAREEAQRDPAPIRVPMTNRLGMYASPDVPKNHYQKVTITLPPAMFLGLDDLARARRRREDPFQISDLV